MLKRTVDDISLEMAQVAQELPQFGLSYCQLLFRPLVLQSLDGRERTVLCPLHKTIRQLPFAMVSPAHPPIPVTLTLANPTLSI